MPRLAVAALCLAAVVGPAPVCAQARVAPAAPTIPATAAGNVLRQWLDAFNSGDSTRLEEFLRHYQPDQHAADELPFRRRTGGFDVVRIEKSEPTHLEYTLRERNSPMVGFGWIDVSGSPVRVTERTLTAIGENANASALHITAADRQRAIEGAIVQLDSFYVFPDVAKKMDDSLRARLARGEYDRYDNGMTFAARIRKDLHDVMHDKHLGMNYSPDVLPPNPPNGERPKPSPQDIARQRERMDEVNCGFDKAEVLEGNVGYLKFDFFADPDLCGPTASAAMNFLAGTRALIIDLRENGGGSPAMVNYVASYLLPPHSHINDLWTRSTNSTEAFFTRESVPGRHYAAEKPVYVLTSHDTFSGGEEFTYDLKTQKRATIVGETTGGGAHPVRGRRIDDHFMIGVPFARAINPVTHTNWEGTGVEPDIKVTADQALATARKLAGDRPRPGPHP